MKKLKLGRTGLDISQVILGGGWVGGLFIDPNFDIMEKAIELSIKAGINWIDTAESYSDGKSEKNIGYLISSLPASDKLQISSKARLDPTISETFVSQLDRKLDNTLNRLKVDKLEKIQFHAFPLPHLELKNLSSNLNSKNIILNSEKLSEVIAAAARARGAGWQTAITLRSGDK